MFSNVSVSNLSLPGDLIGQQKQLSGDVSDLPPALQYLDLAWTSFQITGNLRDLPRNLRWPWDRKSRGTCLASQGAWPTRALHEPPASMAMWRGCPEAWRLQISAVPSWTARWKTYHSTWPQHSSCTAKRLRDTSQRFPTNWRATENLMRMVVDFIVCSSLAREWLSLLNSPFSHHAFPKERARQLAANAATVRLAEREIQRDLIVYRCITGTVTFQVLAQAFLFLHLLKRFCLILGLVSIFQPLCHLQETLKQLLVSFCLFWISMGLS